MPGQLNTLRTHGQSPWIDYITRRFVEHGALDKLIAQGICGVTSNPTIFQKAIAESADYDAQLQQAANDNLSPRDAFRLIACDDVRAACDRLAGVFTESSATRDGWVSLEVDPHLSRDAEATHAEARSLHALVARPNVMVKIPGTTEGLEAIEATVAEGISVNVTLLFSLERHREAAQAYLRGLRRFSAAGGDLATVSSVASFFISRVDTEADRRLDLLGGHDELKGKLAIANAKLAYQSYKAIFSGPGWDDLVRLGASPQRCLWASTSTKDPKYSDVRYVDELIGPDTINTMPPATVTAFEDHGHAADTLEADVEDATRTFDLLDRAGIDYHEIVATLEVEGIQKFADSFDYLLDEIASKLTGPVAT